MDRETQAKAQNVQHLASMPKYLPLFTKKIKDPKALKKQMKAQQVDYTKKEEVATEKVKHAGFFIEQSEVISSLPHSPLRHQEFSSSKP